MAIINLLNSGKSYEPQYNMYPRRDMKAGDMGRTMGWENFPKGNIVRRFDLCACTDCGAIKRQKDSECATIEVGDEIPLVWLPWRSELTAAMINVVGGVTGIKLGLKRYKVVGEDKMVIADATSVSTMLTGVDAAPLPAPTYDPAACERPSLDSFCVGTCQSPGCMEVKNLTSPQVVGSCGYEGQYLSLVIEALPADYDCSACCLQVEVGAAFRSWRAGD